MCCTSGLFWEKMPTNLSPVWECPLWRRAEPMCSALSATCAKQKSVFFLKCIVTRLVMDLYIQVECSMSVIHILPLYKTATHTAGLVSSILDRVHHLWKKIKAHFYLLYIHWKNCIIRNWCKRYTDLILWARVGTPHTSCMHRCRSVSWARRCRSVPTSVHGLHPTTKEITKLRLALTPQPQDTFLWS